jgi:hypothetical protein
LTADQIVDKLIRFANRKGGEENITALVIEIGEQYEVLDTPSVLPPQTSWELLEKELGGIQLSLPKETEHTRLIPYIIGLILFLILGGVFGLPHLRSVLPGGETEFQIKPTCTQVAAIAEPTETVEPTPRATHDPTATDTESSQEVDEIDPTPVPDLPDKADCVYTYLQPDPNTYSLYILLVDVFYLDLTYDQFRNDFASKVVCEDVDDNPCAYDSSAYEYILDGWVLRLPDIPSATCLSVGGEVINK